jgi:hypothetical protein
MMREAIELLQKEMSRRSFFKRSAQVAGIGVFWDQFGDRLFGQSKAATTDPKAVYSAIGNIVIPVDSDPGWATFEPGISDYGLNVFLKQAILAGNDLVFQGLLGTFVAMNEMPPLINYNISRFLDMNESTRTEYFGNILSGQFENTGAQDVLFLATFVGMFSTKAVFFSNYPNHLATPGAEFQVRPSTPIKTGWDIMGFRGPVGPDEENQLRQRYINAEELPGMDPKNSYI